MSEFIKILVKHSLFLSILTNSNLNVLDSLNLDNIKKYTDDGYTITNFVWNDSLSFEQISISKNDEGFYFSFLSQDLDLLTSADIYFDSGNNTRRNLDSIYSKNGYKKRKYFDIIERYNVYITVRPFGNKVLANLIFKEIGSGNN